MAESFRRQALSGTSSSYRFDPVEILEPRDDGRNDRNPDEDPGEEHRLTNLDW